MINNKNQFKNKLKENKNNIIIKRIYNFDKNNKIAEGSTATIEKVQSNAFTIKYDCLGKTIWVYFDNIDIKENKIIYYDYIPDYKREEAKAKAKKLNIELLEVSSDDKINKNNLSNYKYIYKYITMVNEIIEK